MENLQKEFCTYTQALRLKALGFNEPCPTFYTAKGLLYRSIDFNGYTIDKIYPNECLAPTFSQCFRWFRENYKLHSHIRPFFDFDGNMFYLYEILIVKEGRYNNDCCTDVLKTFEEAELACLDKLLEIIESKSE